MDKKIDIELTEHMKNNPLIVFDNVTYKSPNSNDVLIDAVSFTIQKQKVTTIIGPNGAGKTTLLKLILGLIKPTNGHIIQSSDISIGYMPQHLVLEKSLPLTVERFLILSCIHNPSHCMKQRVGEILDFIHIGHCRLKSIHHLSGGEWQRVLLARSLIHSPSFLVLDEPVQCLDHNGQIAFYALLSKIAKEMECTILQVSHDLHLVWEASDEILCLNKHICCHGAPDYVKKSPSFNALFSGFLPYTHHHDHQHDAFDSKCQHSQKRDDTCSHSS